MHRQYGKLAALALGAFGVFGCSSNSETVTSQRARNWSEADTDAITAAAPEPEKKISADTHFAAGHLLEKQGALMKAIKQYEKALTLDPHHVPSLNRVAMLYAKTGHHAEAEAALRRALKAQPDSPLLHNNLGYECVQQKRWAEAAESFQRAIELKPDFVRAHINLGLTLARLDRFDDALAHFRVGLPAPDAYYNLGLMLRGKQRYQDAVQAFQTALDHNPAFVAARKQIDQIAPRLTRTGQVNPPPQWETVTTDEDRPADDAAQTSPTNVTDAGQPAAADAVVLFEDDAGANASPADWDLDDIEPAGDLAGPGNVADAAVVEAPAIAETPTTVVEPVAVADSDVAVAAPAQNAVTPAAEAPALPPLDIVIDPDDPAMTRPLAVDVATEAETTERQVAEAAVQVEASDAVKDPAPVSSPVTEPPALTLTMPDIDVPELVARVTPMVATVIAEMARAATREGIRTAINQEAFYRPMTTQVAGAQAFIELEAHWESLIGAGTDDRSASAPAAPITLPDHGLWSLHVMDGATAMLASSPTDGTDGLGPCRNDAIEVLLAPQAIEATAADAAAQPAAVDPAAGQSEPQPLPYRPIEWAPVERTPFFEYMLGEVDVYRP